MKRLAPLLLAASPSLADDAFVEANVLSIFYHELGHAVIHTEFVPIFAQEEDAADVFSIFLIDLLFEDDVALSIATDAAIGFWLEAEERGETIPWWDVHGPDEQRYYNTICLFYGADPENRATFAADFELPEDRAAYCPDEYAQAADAWGPVLDALEGRGPGTTMTFTTKEDSLTATILREEIEALNAEVSFARPITVRLEPCGEINAFYDPGTRTILFCSEFEPYLRSIFQPS